MANSKLFDQIDALLTRVQKPGRYVGGEVNAIVKDPATVSLRWALAFPDLYELGMSYMGFQILYHLLNQRSDVAAERVYAPWPDMEAALREENLPLFTLETRTPLSDFDLVGFTLQYELHYTNILMMLDLGGIPLRSTDRGEDDPIIIAGGPCAFNPEPVAEFLDAIVIGDGEEVIHYVVDRMIAGKRDNLSREDRLLSLAGIHGVYVPRFYRPEYGADGHLRATVPVTDRVPARVKAAVVTELRNDFYPEAPVLPTMETAHSRYSLELMRGCTQGCRFCGAGYIYRPVRERKVNVLVTQARARVESIGSDEISLTSLSTTDYSQLPTLMDALKREFTKTDTKASFGFPSLRPDRFTEQMADFGADGKKSGVTLACEAGTERLRRVLNKNITEDGVLQSARNAFSRGYRTIKLYFMIGLPTETDEDLLAIPDLAHRIWKESVPYGVKATINLSVGPFCPKPFTPFQWEAQDSIAELKRKMNLIRDALRKKTRHINFKWRDPKVSFLEGVLGKADRRVAPVIEAAYRQGARFDGWSEHFDIDRWNRCFAEIGLDPHQYIAARPHDCGLPWDHIDKEVTKEFLLTELDLAMQEKTTEDCRDNKCFRCGVLEIKHCTINVVRVDERKTKQRYVLTQGEVRASDAVPQGLGQFAVTEERRRVRLQYAKFGSARHQSHLDLMQTWTRAIRRARIPMEHTQGYNRHYKISYGPPLPTSYTSTAELMDLYVRTDAPGADLRDALNRQLPHGLEVLDMRDAPETDPAITASVIGADYQVTGLTHDPAAIEAGVRDAWNAEEMMIVRPRKGQRIDMRPFLAAINYDSEHNALDLRIRFLDGRTVKVVEILSYILRCTIADARSYGIARTLLHLERPLAPQPQVEQPVHIATPETEDALLPV